MRTEGGVTLKTSGLKTRVRDGRTGRTDTVGSVSERSDGVEVFVKEK